MTAQQRANGRSPPVVHLTAEYWPFARTGGLAEAVRGLAEHQAQSGRSTTIVMPLYRGVHDVTDALTAETKPVRITVGRREHEFQVFRYTGNDVTPRVYFIDHPASFDRDGVYGDGGGDYPDNLMRFAVFCRAAVEILPVVAPEAAILHSHDWHTALAIAYLRITMRGSPFHDRVATVLSAHNAAYQGHFPAASLPQIGLPWDAYDYRQFEWYGRVNILKGGLANTDMATTVSPTHAAELCTADGGFGLHQHFEHLGSRFVGILNGIDYSLWDPSRDPYITARYEAKDLAPKARCKSALQRTYGLPRRSRTPVFAMSARLVEQKGFDLLLQPGVLDDLDVQLIVIGRGDTSYEHALATLAAANPDRISVPLNFNERLEHRLLAGADLLLMPSQFEPCGLTQMRAQRYGTVPVVRRVGGLNDTVVNGETGFLFDAYDGNALARALRRAVAAYYDPATWTPIMRRGMAQDYSWAPSAHRYAEIYRRAIAARAEAL